jgi:myosin-1
LRRTRFSRVSVALRRFVTTTRLVTFVFPFLPLFSFSRLTLLRA